jgi:uncharacterized phage protein gp47/JayE
MAGITNNGFIIKRLNEIKDEFKEDFKAIFPDTNIDDDTTIDGQINSLFADAFSDIWELAQDVYNSNDVDAAEQYNLDKLVNLVGVQREQESFGTTFLNFYTSSSPYTIPIGYKASLSSDTSIIFETYESAVSSVVDQTNVWYFETPDAGTFNITIDGATTAALPYNETQSNIKSALNGLGFGTIVSLLIGSWANGVWKIYFNDGIKHDVSITNNLTISGAPTRPIVEDMRVNLWGGTYARVGANCLTAGNIPANSLTINNLITVDANVTEVFNPDDATPGKDLETDAELRFRRNTFINQSPSNTEAAMKNAIFALNETDTREGYQIKFVRIDSDTTSHEYEPIVHYPLAPAPTTITSDKDQEIAEAIFSAAPIGIENVGDEVFTVVDQDGNSRTVKFSRPSAVDIYLDLTLTIDSSLFPSEGVQTITNNIISWGNDLGIGQDVVVFGTNSLISLFNNIDGITDVTVDIGTAPTPSGDANVTIGDTAFSNWESANISITLV